MGENLHSNCGTHQKAILPALIGRYSSVLGLFKQDHTFPPQILAGGGSSDDPGGSGKKEQQLCKAGHSQWTLKGQSHFMLLPAFRLLVYSKKKCHK